MYFQFALSGETFGRLIRFRLADQFRPFAETIEHTPGQKSWVDGFIVTNVALRSVPRDREVALNELDPNGRLRAVGDGAKFWSPSISALVTARIWLAKAEDVATAGLEPPPVTAIPIPPGIVTLNIRMDIDVAGLPQLKITVQKDQLDRSGLPDRVKDYLKHSSEVTVPINLATLLKDVLPAGANKVLNVALTLSPDGAVVMRFELSDHSGRTTSYRTELWRKFAEEDPQSDLGQLDWCVSIDGEAIAHMMADKISPYLQSDPPIYFDPSYLVWSFEDAPRAIVKKIGRIENACSGNDIRFDAFINVDFTVSQENVLRSLLGFDYNKDGWDVAKCIGLTIIDPFAVPSFLFNMVKQKGLAVASLAFPPIGAAVALVAMVLLILGVDDDVAQQLVAKELSKDPTLVKVGDRFALDKRVQLDNALTRDWLVLTNVAGRSGRLLLRGVSRIPVARLPRLRGNEIDGFGEWALRDPCNPPGQETVASLTLAVEPGYVDEGEPSVSRPTIPLKYGVRPDGSQVIYEILDDQLGIYSEDYGNYYRPVDLDSIPGVLRARLLSEVVLLEKYADFGIHPYQLRVRFFTNGGVREYAFQAPPVFHPYVETTAQAVERINRCKLLMVDPLKEAQVGLRWLVDPAPDASRFWQIHLLGLESGQRVSVSDPSGQTLATAYGTEGGRAEVALLLGPDRDQLTVSVDGLSRPVPVAVRQANCTPIERIQVGEPVSEIKVKRNGGYLELTTNTARGAATVTLTDAMIVDLSSRPDGLGLERPAAQADWRGSQRAFAVVDQSAGQTRVLADYEARSALDRTATIGALLLRADDEGHVDVLRCGPARVFAGPQWDGELQ